MYETIKTVMFGDTEVTIYKNTLGEYFAEYEDGYTKKKVPCGKDYRFIWEELSKELGGDDTPEGEDILKLADTIEQKLDDVIDTDTLLKAIDQALFDAPRLYPYYIRDDIKTVLTYRWAPMNGVLQKLRACATLEEWFKDCIATKRIYRLTDPECYEEQPCYIKNAYIFGNQWYVEFAIVEMKECEDSDNRFWYCDSTIVFPISRVRLEHNITDELPADY